MLTGILRQLLFNVGWDTRCRNTDVARILKPLITQRSFLLDAGCGDYGLADFVRPAIVVGVDVSCPMQRNDNFIFICGSILTLPFSDHSIPLVASVDTLEHLPPITRVQAIGELVRVAGTAVVLTFPCGQLARYADEDFRNRLANRHKPEPCWLAEHLQNPYPEVESVLTTIQAEAARYHRSVRARIYHSEHIEIARVLRRAASRSKFLYIAANILTGLLLPIIPSPGRDNSYRTVVVAEFQSSKSNEDH
jgi:hypothetical protein